MNEQQENGQRARRFDPNDHLVQLKSRQGSQDYLPVQWRLVWFRENCPQGTIETEEVLVDLDREVEVEAYVWNNEKRKSEKVTRRAKGYARFRATVTDGKGGSAIGTKSENAANFADYIEKAETGSIGRALAALGFGTAYASEMDEGPRIVDSPTEHREPAHNSSEQQHTPTNGTSPAASKSAHPVNITEEQVKSIRKGCQVLGKEEPENLEQMTYQEAKALHVQLMAEYKARKQQQQAVSSAS